MDSTSGYFLFNESKVMDSINEIRNSFKDSYNNFSLGYSIKANYDKHFIQTLNKKEVIFDCASEKELNLLLENNIDPKNISISSPFLYKELIDRCFSLGVFIYADSFHQLLLLEECVSSFDNLIEIGLRLSLTNYSASRFGVEVTSLNMAKIRTFFQENSLLSLRGLHAHYSPTDRSSDNFERRIDNFFETITAYFKDLNIKSINLGGGFSSEMSPSIASQFDYKIPSWKDYGEAYKNVREKHSIENVTIIIEPGMGLAAHAYHYVAEVISIKNREHENIALLNTSILFLKPTGHSKSLDFEVETPSPTLGETNTYSLVGISCMEKDVLGSYKGYLEIGTKIIFKNVGAYTLSFRENFIFDQPKVHVNRKLVHEMG